MTDIYEHEKPYALTLTYQATPVQSDLSAPYDLHVAYDPTAGGGSSEVSFEVLATLPSPTANFKLERPKSLSILATLESPTAALSLSYDANVIRNMTHDGGLRFQGGAYVSGLETPKFSNGVQSRVERAIDWQSAHLVESYSTLTNIDGVALKTTTTTNWQDGIHIQIQSDTKFTDLTHDWLNTASHWQECTPVYEVSTTRFKDLLPRPVHKELSWSGSKYLTLVDTFKFAEAIRLQLERRVRWQITTQPWWGKATVLPPTPQPYQPSVNLDFVCRCLGVDPLHVRLNFGAKPCPDQLLDQKVYFIVNTLTLKRVSDNLPIEVFGASIGIDKGSWCWSFNATIPYDQLVDVQPNISGPVEVELSINGIIWRVIVESFSENKQFAKTAVSITGRSKTAYLDSPYAPTRSLVQSEATTSRQMAEAELSRVGLVTGFTLDWQLVDALGWAMPANTWSYQDLTPIQVIQQIAEGAGGYVNSSTLGDNIIVLPDYSVPFWQWASATVDKTIPLSMIKTQSLKWTEKPSYNGVYVSGENTGVTGFVRRYGTDGGFQAPAFVNPMISAEAAARSKGISILSSGGKQASVGLDLPMHEDLGLVTPGMLIEVDPSAPWRGIVRSTSIAATRGSSLTVTQSIELERHYEDA